MKTLHQLQIPLFTWNRKNKRKSYIVTLPTATFTYQFSHQKSEFAMFTPISLKIRGGGLMVGKLCYSADKRLAELPINRICCDSIYRNGGGSGVILMKLHFWKHLSMPSCSSYFFPFQTLLSSYTSGVSPSQ